MDVWYMFLNNFTQDKIENTVFKFLDAYVGGGVVIDVDYYCYHSGINENFFVSGGSLMWSKTFRIYSENKIPILSLEIKDGFTGRKIHPIIVCEDLINIVHKFIPKLEFFIIGDIILKWYFETHNLTSHSDLEGYIYHKCYFTK